ncbi:helix-turn-helix transcriptional regulator [Candidatus Finniella inopinata]|uniref:XRE family transcriptional regulator n=1 Tax=Candidatus Finniella inopinata TaxID=1696036 RepID=A0A4Q7DGD1_9PROT|nr:helix-turn-helix transcriptional regulator [Candidatus Finniella inopinata]RZI45109.1 XRE family transcriptional regulator [Candidatus Finniella inopinata]
MTNNFTGDHFVYWINKMGISYEEAADLLNVSLSTIEGYAYGVYKIPEDKAQTCRLLLRFKMKRERAE